MTFIADASVAGTTRYWLRNAEVFKRTWILSMAAWFIEPVLYLIAMGLGLGRYLERLQGVSYIQFIAPGLLGVAVMWGATFDSTWNAWFKMERARLYEATTATPVSYSDVALGEMLWAASRGSMYGIAFALIAVPFGVFRSPWGLLVPIGLGLLGLVFAITGLAFTYTIREIDYLSYYWTLFLAPMFMFAGVFFPLDRLPDWVHVVAWFMPLYHGGEIFRSLMLYGDPLRALGSAVWLVVFAGALVWVPPRLLRRRFLH